MRIRGLRPFGARSVPKHQPFSCLRFVANALRRRSFRRRRIVLTEIYQFDDSWCNRCVRDRLQIGSFFG